FAQAARCWRDARLGGCARGLGDPRPAPGARGRVRNARLPAQDARRPRADDARGRPPPAGQGRLSRTETSMRSTAERDLPNPLGAALRLRLVGFVRMLRDHRFAIGLAETRDALAVLASPAAVRPDLLGAALRAIFCATRSDWDRFEGLFAA